MRRRRRATQDFAQRTPCASADKMLLLCVTPLCRLRCASDADYAARERYDIFLIMRSHRPDELRMRAYERGKDEKRGCGVSDERVMPRDVACVDARPLFTSAPAPITRSFATLLSFYRAHARRQSSRRLRPCASRARATQRA